MDPFSAKALSAAIGYLELGMPEDAAHEISSLAPAAASTTEALRVRSAVSSCLKKWEELEAVTRELHAREPDEPAWPIQRAYATRRFRSLDEARNILLEAERKYPAVALIQFNLACYAAVAGDLGEAEQRLEKAFLLDAQFRELAREDPDLEPLRRIGWNPEHRSTDGNRHP